jgi:hypothetical protein
LFSADSLLLIANRLQGELPLAGLEQLGRESGAAAMRAYREMQSGEAYVYFDYITRRNLDAADLTECNRRAAALLPEAELACHALKRVQYVEGAASGQPVGVHYVVELEYAASAAPELQRWYHFEHLPGFASVAGCVRTTRLLSQSGRSFACYDLVSADVPKSEEWMKWRGTEWTKKVQQHYQSIKRGLFVPLE